MKLFAKFILLVFFLCADSLILLAEEGDDDKDMWAWLDDVNMVTVNLSKKIATDSDIISSFKVSGKSGDLYDIVKAEPVILKGAKTNKFRLFLGSDITDVSSPLFVEAAKLRKTCAIPRNILDRSEYYYPGADLGFQYSREGTKFKLWAPTAIAVAIQLYDHYNNSEQNYFKKIPMYKMEKGTWYSFAEGDLNGKYYLFEVALYDNGKIKKYLVQDPYSFGSSVNSMKSMVFDRNDVIQAVPGWDQDTFVSLKNYVDAVIYEIHIRDFTIDQSSGISAALRGRYKGLSVFNSTNDKGLTSGIDHLNDLGITHVQILPVFDWGYGDEAESNIAYTWYDWGYDPALYNNIEGSYASDPNGLTRYIEYKKMIQALHSCNVGVVFDSVYNHTYQTGSKPYSIFDKIVPMYYYRVGDDGKYVNGSFCGNTVATERPMVRKFIVDSVKYLVKEYHIDGFRFDLMGIMDKDTVTQISSEVKALNPNAILYGEGWSIPCGIETDSCMVQANVQNTGVGAFNDGIRNSIVGNVLKNKSTGYAQGVYDALTVQSLKDQLRGLVTGGDNNNPVPVATPNESINYVSCHDNLCIWDKLKASMPGVSDEELAKRSMLAFGMVITSQGVPFLPEGDDFGRTKGGNDNSYNENDPDVNPINWNLKSKNQDMFKFFKGMISLRKAHPAFRMYDKAQVVQTMKFLSKLPDGVIAYILTDNPNGDKWKNIFVGFNNSLSDKTLQIPANWHIVVRGKDIDQNGISIVQNVLTIPALGVLIAFTDNDIVSYEL